MWLVYSGMKFYSRSPKNKTQFQVFHLIKFLIFPSLRLLSQLRKVPTNLEVHRKIASQLVWSKSQTLINVSLSFNIATSSNFLATHDNLNQMKENEDEVFCWLVLLLLIKFTAMSQKFWILFFALNTILLLIICLIKFTCGWFYPIINLRKTSTWRCGF